MVRANVADKFEIVRIVSMWVCRDKLFILTRNFIERSCVGFVPELNELIGRGWCFLPERDCTKNQSCLGLLWVAAFVLVFHTLRVF